MTIDMLKRVEPVAQRSVSRGTTIATQTIGDAWIRIAKLILDQGASGDWEGLPLSEVELVTLDISAPDSEDALITRHASADWLAWMRANFTDERRVAALGDAHSYASRIFDYGGSGRDQLAWVVEKLRRDPVTSNVTITTLEPLTDTTYIPCVSLLDFWLRAGRLELVVYCHSIDFGKKGFANLVQLAELQRHIADEITAPLGNLTMIVKSAHIYDTEIEPMRRVVDQVGPF